MLRSHRNHQQQPSQKKLIDSLWQETALTIFLVQTPNHMLNDYYNYCRKKSDPQSKGELLHYVRHMFVL
jgi:DNA replicative helicase MCM subunit Mcm2 (Cdc46/Mcm family)